MTVTIRGSSRSCHVRSRTHSLHLMFRRRRRCAMKNRMIAFWIALREERPCK
jgi:hypothetical protein